MSTAASATPSCFAELPLSGLQNILQRLSLSERLTGCAMVCRQWSEAALAASSSINKVLPTEEAKDSFLDWLDQHADSVTSLKLAPGDPDTAEDISELNELPCSSSLRGLELTGFCLQLGDAGVLTDATGLTRLAITVGDLHPYTGAFSAIEALTSLQELTLSSCGASTTAFRPMSIPGDGLAALTQLTKLALTDAAAHPWATLQHISRLIRLQDLTLAQLYEYGDSDSVSEYLEPGVVALVAWLATLDGVGRLQQLTRLVVCDVEGSLSRQHLLAGHSQQPQPAVLTALQHLDLQQTEFEPGLLGGMTQLTYLRLSALVLVAEGPADAPAQSAAEGLGAYQLLLALPCLQQLRVLRLDIDHWPDAPDQLPAYSALTANSKLEHLDLQELEWPLPAAAWKHIFRQELQLPGIAFLTLPGIAPESSEDRVLSCCPTVAADIHQRFAEPCLELRCLDCDDDEDDVSSAELRLLEVNADDTRGAPAVLAAPLTHLEVIFSGRFHGFGVHSCTGDVWSGKKRSRTIW